MRLTRIHVGLALSAGAEFALPEAAAAHLARVLRLQVGDACVLFNGDGHDYDARITVIGKREARAEIDAARRVDNESPLRITLLQGIARGEKMDWILQKATELGVTRIVPLVTERTEVKLDAERAARRRAHWEAVLASACEQCGRNRLPRIDEPVRLVQWVTTLDDDAGLRLALDPDGDVNARELVPGTQVTLAVGPEGGLSDHDLAALAQAGFRGLRLGPRILRTETAGLAALAALQVLHGDL